jgi:hypothetical protein
MAAWQSADPGVSTTPHQRVARAPKASDPGDESVLEYVFLDDTACNLASINPVTLRETVSSMTTVIATPSGCGRWRSRSACSWPR